MLRKKLSWVLISAALAAATASAQDSDLARELNGYSARALPQPSMTLEPDFLFADSAQREGLERVILKITDSAGRTVFSESSAGEPIALFLSDLDLADGRYRYTVTSVYAKTGPVAAVPGLKDSVRSSGSFVVRDGAITADRDRSDDTSGEDQASNSEGHNLLLSGLAMVADFLVGSAHASDLSTDEDGDIVLEDDSPSIFIEYGANPFTLDGIGVWRFDFWEGSASAPDFDVFDDTNNRDVLTLQTGAPADSLFAGADGTVSLNGGAVEVTPTGMTVNGSVLAQAQDASALIALLSEDTSDTYTDVLPIMFATYGSANPGTAGFGLNFNLFGPTPLFVEFLAPTDSLRIKESGTISTGGKIHVGAQNDPVGQFTITSPDQPRFEMNDTTTGKRWRFSVASDKFAINNLDEAGTEFQVFDNGNVLIAGALTQNSDRNAKQDIVPVDQHSVLERIANLPIAEWSYKDAPQQRHIGPMAQDFYAAFGLGMNDTGITTLDTSGVALAGIQALKVENDRLAQENAELKARMDDMESRQLEIVATLATLRAEIRQPAPVVASLSD